MTPSGTLFRGGSAVSGIYRGANPVNSIYRGGSLIWTGAPIFDGFDNSGWLNNWINELLSGDPAALVSDHLGQLWDGLNNFVGSVVAFVQGGTNQLGQLVTHTGTALVDAYCAAWGGTAPATGGGPGTPLGIGGGGTTPVPSGLLGLINGIPLIGPYINSALSQVINLVTHPSDIFSLIGTIPVIGNLASAIGLIPDQITGVISAPLNFIIDKLGAVLGTLTCGAYTPTAAMVSEDIQYVIGMINQRARMLIPSGVLSLNTQTSRYRWPTPLTNDDGFVEVRLADAGNGPGMMTEVFRRYSDSGFHQGTGMYFIDGTVGIVHRASDADSLVSGGVASAGGGDRFRLVQAGSTHTLFKNGQNIGSASGIAAPGAGSRSVGMLMQGGKEHLGPVQNSASLDYLEAA